MSFEEEFDKIIRQKSEELQYPFDEDSWAKARQMVDADRKANSGGWMRFMLPGGLVLGTAVAGILIASSMNENAQVAVHKTAAEKNIITTEPALENAITPEPSAEVKTTSIVKTQVQITPHVEVISSPATVVRADESTPVNVNISEMPVKDVITVQSSAQKQDEQKIQATEKIAPPEVITQAEPVASPEQQTAVPAQINTSDAIKENAAVATGQVTSVEETIVAENAEWLGPRNAFLEQQITDPDAITKILLPAVYDDYVNRRAKFHYMNIEGGACYLAGWSTVSGRDAKGLNAFAGLNYGIYISSRVSIGLGAQVYNISHITRPLFEGQATVYDFGSVNTGTVINTTDLYYAAVPLKLNYSLNRNNIVSAGINAGYAVRANNTSRTFTEQDGSRSYSEAVSSDRVYTSVNSYNIMASFGWQMNVSRRWAISTEIVYGLTDLVNGGPAPAVEKPAGVRLGLRYTIFDK